MAYARTCPKKYLLRTPTLHRRPLAIYESLVTDGGYKADSEQRKAIEELDRIWVELTAHPVRTMLGAGENDHRLGVGVPDQFPEKVALPVRRDRYRRFSGRPSPARYPMQTSAGRSGTTGPGRFRREA